MDMVWLNSQCEYLPVVFCCYFLNDVMQAFPNGANQDVPSSFWAENDMIDNQMNIVIVMFVFHVDTLPENNDFSKSVLSLSPNPKIRNGFSSPGSNRGGFQAGNSL